MLSRGLVGVGEASYSCVAPTIIADMYKDDMRTRMLALFNIAVPLGRLVRLSMHRIDKRIQILVDLDILLAQNLL